MNKYNIYQDRNQDLFRLFEQAGNHSKLMCVPIDYAKKDHMVMFCNGYGDILRKPFPKTNSQGRLQDAWQVGSASRRHDERSMDFFNRLGREHYLLRFDILRFDILRFKL